MSCFQFKMIHQSLYRCVFFLPTSPLQLYFDLLAQECDVPSIIILNVKLWLAHFGVNTRITLADLLDLKSDTVCAASGAFWLLSCTSSWKVRRKVGNKYFSLSHESIGRDFSLIPTSDLIFWVLLCWQFLCSEQWITYSDQNLNLTSGNFRSNLRWKIRMSQVGNDPLYLTGRATTSSSAVRLQWKLKY